jgi:tryptophan synthase alpha subunit
MAALKAAGRSGLIPFVTSGDPHPDWMVGILHALVEGGADILELGVPFSDPMADGPVIQKSSERALERGMTLDRTLAIVREFRDRDTTTPIVLMGYLNPVEYYGWEKFATNAKSAGVDGLLIVDCPPEEADSVRPVLAKHGLDQIFLASPTTTDARIATMGELAQGYVYYVSFAGITGPTCWSWRCRARLDDSASKSVCRSRSVSASRRRRSRCAGAACRCGRGRQRTVEQLAAATSLTDANNAPAISCNPCAAPSMPPARRRTSDGAFPLAFRYPQTRDRP